MQPAPGLLHLTASSRQKSPKYARSPGTQLGIEPRMPSHRETQPSGTRSLCCWASSFYGLGTICSRRDIKAHVSLKQTHKIQEIASSPAASTGSKGKAELPSDAPWDTGLPEDTMPVGTCAAPARAVPTVLGCSRCPLPPHTANLQTQAQNPEEPPGAGRSLGLAPLPILYHSDRQEMLLCSHSLGRRGPFPPLQRFTGTVG